MGMAVVASVEHAREQGERVGWGFDVVWVWAAEFKFTNKNERENEPENDHFCTSEGRVRFFKNYHFRIILDLIFEFIFKKWDWKWNWKWAKNGSKMTTVNDPIDPTPFGYVYTFSDHLYLSLSFHLHSTSPLFSYPLCILTIPLHRPPSVVSTIPTEGEFYQYHLSLTRYLRSPL